MIEISNTYITGWDQAIMGMRNAYRTWDRSDSQNGVVGPNDISLMKKLANAGHSHAKYRRMIVVYADILAPLYWWKEFDTYKVGTVALSESTMHNICDHKFDISDFSHEHLGCFELLPEMVGGVEVPTPTYIDFTDSFKNLIDAMNVARAFYLRFKEEGKDEMVKQAWWQIIQLLPTSYNQHRTVMLNYENLSAMYKDRKNHKLDEWRYFCDWIRGLLYSGFITGEG